ncbi:MAG: type II/IV secretion system ATPase subunit [Thermoplasmatales archaeon]|nr:type II/IV secretion system ATPase subunit [Thermoplasmatales archaeon]
MNYRIIKEGGLNLIEIDCYSCNYSSSLLDENCRRELIEIIGREGKIDRIKLNHYFVKIIEGEALENLFEISKFKEELSSLRANDCNDCIFSKEIKGILELADKDQIKSFFSLSNLFYKLKKPFIFRKEECEECRSENLRKMENIIRKFEKLRHISYEDIRIYLRPIFFDTSIEYTPPNDAIFIKSYEIKRERGSIKVSLYELKRRAEKLYFIIPPEYNINLEELKILIKAKEKLAKHRPPDTSFMDPERTREYFYRFGKEKIIEIAKNINYKISSEKIDFLADIFAKYTSGFGILEDLLADKKIQDIYINAPVSYNPLHIVLEGEEYVTNIYFSENDIEALSSRLRSLSGRGFSEAIPVMDVGLPEYDSRITAISPPITPKGIAFAIRRHSSELWTLPKFISCKMLSPLAAGMLSFFIDGQATILIAGSRGAGKTSLLSSLMLEIPQRYRILTIEDTPELPVDELQRLGYKIQSLVTKSAVSNEGIDEKTAIKTALRLGESVIILGEVRGEEAKILFEAMRIGAAGNLVMGTIHGSTSRDVFDRIVYDIGVPPVSFKATDVVVIASPIRVGGGIERLRRVIQISEVSKKWEREDVDKIFYDIMQYDYSKDMLEATDIFYMGQSEIIGKIARKWGIRMEDAIENIKMRARMKEKIAEIGKTDAKFVRDANNFYWSSLEETKNFYEIEEKWNEWLKKHAI